MVDRRKDLPTVNSPIFLQQVREAVSTYLGNRGDKLDRGVTVRDLVDAGLVELNAGYLGGTGKVPIKGPGPDIGSGGGAAEEPDLTPPPTPTGAQVTPTFNNLIVEHDVPVYTQGHGHARTRVYGAQWTSGPLPTFASAELITEFTGTVFSHPTTLGTTWHIWLKWVTVDGIESTVPAGGTNGIAATTGKVGSSDLGAAAVLSQALAPNSVTADKAMLDVGGINMAANSSFDYVDGSNAPFNWFTYGDGTGTTFTGGRLGGRFFRYTHPPGFDTWQKGVAGGALSGKFASGQYYVVSFYARVPAGSGLAGLQCALQWNQTPDTTALRNPPLTTAWQRYAFRIRWTGAVEVTGNVYLAVQPGAQTGAIDFDDVQVEEGETLTGYSGKLALNTIIAGDGAIGNLAITNALIANAAVDTAKIADASISAAKIGDAQITTAKIADATITAAKIADAQITTAKIQDGAITNAKIGNAQVNFANINTATIGTLAALTAFTGTLTVDTNGYIRSGKGNYADNTAGFYLGNDGGTPKFAIGDALQWLKWTGTALDIKLNVVTPSAGTISSQSFATGSATRALGTLTTTASGGTPPYSYQWTLQSVSIEPGSGGANANNYGGISASGASCTFNARGAGNCGISVTAVCTVTDSNGLSATLSRDAYATFGSGPS